MTSREAIQILEEIETDVVLGGSWLFEGERGQDVLKTIELAIQALEKQEPVYVIEKPGKHMHLAVSYFCECGKEQKNTFKNRREGCFCGRCGQKLLWKEVE